MNSVEIPEDTLNQKTCGQCNQPIAPESRFCSHCGVAQNAVVAESGEEKWGIVKQLAIFFLFDIFICCIATRIAVFKTFTWSVVFDVLLAMITVTFFCDRWQENKSLLNWPGFSLRKLVAYITAAVVCSVLVSYCVGWLNRALFSEEFYYYGFYATHKYGAALMLFFVAVMPALFEELAYRGYVLQKLLAIVDTKPAIFISSFLFAILHMTFISLFWLLPFALSLGYVCVKENTLWYGVFIHFSFNCTVCMMELYAASHH